MNESVYLCKIRVKTSILLAIIFCVFAFQNVFTVIHFVINQNALTEAFCINKDKPALMCNGKCYLEKKLAASNKTPDNSIIEIELKENQYIPIKINFFGKKEQIFLKNINWVYLFPATSQGIEQLFRPPIFY